MNITEGHDGAVIAELHKPANAQIHLATIIKTVQAVVPVLAQIVEQGICEGVCHTPYPRETLNLSLSPIKSSLTAAFLNGAMLK